MSLVGPRREQIELVEMYAEQHRFRLAVKPGMTGRIQIYGREQLRFEERVAVKCGYVQNVSVARELCTPTLTVMPVVSGQGAI